MKSLASAPDSSSPACDECCALLDDAGASESDPSSRLYTGYVGRLACGSAAELAALFDEMQHALQRGLYAVGLFAYELGSEMHGITPRTPMPPLAQILLFEHCRHLSGAGVAAWLAARETPGMDAADTCPAGVAGMRADVDAAEFADAISRIRSYIESGDTYQVNYTYRLNFLAYGTLSGLYARLRARQAVPYGALITLPDGGAVLSLSPELFVRHRDGELLARPMKGTAAASGIVEVDRQRSQALASDAKNRAENLMIVDLLRNDIGRVAAVGSVRVPDLFEVRPYGAVLQMTSTVSARLRPDVTLSELFAALYPCGSITGAPKRRTMQIIRELEANPRGIYTGGIGWFDQPSQGRRIGNFCLSVPIRTLVLGPADSDGLRPGQMGVGAGIVHGSEAASEYQECRLKARFLTGIPAEFELFETMYATRGGGCRHLDLHLERLRRSAEYFGFSYDEAAIRNAVAQACAQLEDGIGHRLRLSLSHAGAFNLQSGALTDLATPVRVMLAPQPATQGALFLRHKTTLRRQYDEAWRAAERCGAFDMVFCNAAGELTEGARSNIFVRIGGRWYTPPLEAGLLPGVMRSVVLADPQWRAREKRLSLDDLRTAEQLMVCNALRGMLPAVVEW